MADHPLHQSHPEITKRLKRAAGHLAGVIEMIEAGRPCLDLAQQLHAVESAIGNANAGYEQFSKTSKQAVEAIEANLASAVNQFTQAAEKVVPRAAAK